MSNTRNTRTGASRLALSSINRRKLVQAGAAAGAAATLARVPAAARASAQAASYDGEAATITYGFWDSSQQAAVEAQLAAFSEQFPEITVELRQVPWEDYWTQLQTGAAGGEVFDVFWINSASLPVYASSGVLSPIDSIIEDGSVDPSLFPAPVVDMYTYENAHYGIPRDFDTIGLFYNRDIFDAAGVEYPTDAWTWDDFRAAAEELTDESAGQWGAGLQTSWQENYYNFIWQNEGRLLSDDRLECVVDEPAACEAFEYLTGFFTDGLTPSIAIQQSNPVADSLFPAGQVAMMTGGSFRAGAYGAADANIDVAPLPQGKVRATAIHGLANVMWSGSENPGAALELVRFLAGEEAERILGESGATMPALEGMQENWLAAVPDMNLQVFVDAAEYSVLVPDPEVGFEWQIAIQGVVIEGWSGDIPAEEICVQAAEAANAALSGS
ncbi:MAG: sugar ABC transporter substrate-binding protein [Chloroflexota bacterium]|nr:sugar ABC transporter substrate-binding protein [Chloroflexota bacterium]